MVLESYAFTSVGGRDENQDAIGRIELGSRGLYVVADGLGGHQSGRLAADCAVRTLLRDWKPDASYNLNALSDKIGTANEAILALQQEKNCVTKSTVVALSVDEERAVWANTGDSRLYFIRGGRIARVTEDHSVAYKKYKAGEICRAELATDEDQSSLLRVLGNSKRWEPDLDEVTPLCLGDAFLLCSDGFWEYVMDEEILFDYLKSDTAEDWASLMLLRAAERIPPNNDNISLITIMLK